MQRHFFLLFILSHISFWTLSALCVFGWFHWEFARYQKGGGWWSTMLRLYARRVCYGTETASKQKKRKCNLCKFSWTRRIMALCSFFSSGVRHNEANLYIGNVRGTHELSLASIGHPFAYGLVFQSSALLFSVRSVIVVFIIIILFLIIVLSILCLVHGRWYIKPELELTQATSARRTRCALTNTHTHTDTDAKHRYAINME